MSNGALYVATGEQFVEEAEVAAKSLSEQMPDLPIAIVTNEETNPTGFDKEIKLSDPSYGFEDKIKGLQRAPYDRTLFLDTDTLVAENIAEVFDLLDNFDVAVTHNQNRDLFSENPGVPDCFPEHSTGVISLKKSTTQDFFKRWLRLYDDGHSGDQISFRKALYESDIRVATLPREYNYSVRTPAHIVDNAKVFHGRLFRIDSPGAARYYTMRVIYIHQFSYAYEIPFENEGW